MNNENEFCDTIDNFNELNWYMPMIGKNTIGVLLLESSEFPELRLISKEDAITKLFDLAIQGYAITSGKYSRNLLYPNSKHMGPRTLTIHLERNFDNPNLDADIVESISETLEAADTQQAICSVLDEMNLDKYQ